MTQSNVALLVDGSALFLASRQVDPSRNLDYRLLNNRLLQEVRAGFGSFDPAIFWTSYDSANEGQAKFLDFISKQVRWTVDAVPVHDAVAAQTSGGQTTPPTIRFGERIAYALGRLSAKGRTSIVVLSDQFSLCAPMLDVVNRGGMVWLAFFGGQLDARFHRQLRSGVREAAYEQGRASTYVDLLKPDADQSVPRGLRFIDLDDYVDEIWGVPKRAAHGASTGIGGFTRIP